MTQPEIITATERAARKAARGKQSIGLGDAIASIATPIARALHLPCIDPATKQLRPDSPCAKRKGRLNKIIPNLIPPKDKPFNPLDHEQSK